MPLIAPGVYVETADKPYEFEVSYYLNFQIISALASIEYIMADQPQILAIFENKYQYYHYYTDHLLYSMGQISNRFVVDTKDKGIILERKQANKKNFQFSPTDFPILSDKKCRNTIEHIDEHNQKIIIEHAGVGGFNVIDRDTDPNVVKQILNLRHPYTLDLLNREVIVLRNNERLSVKIDGLKDELLKLHTNVKYFSEMIKSIF